MIDLHRQIADLEDETDALAHSAEQCRKSMIVVKVAVGGAMLLFAASLLDLILSDAIILVLGITAAHVGTPLDIQDAIGGRGLRLGMRDGEGDRPDQLKGWLEKTAPDAV